MGVLATSFVGFTSVTDCVPYFGGTYLQRLFSTFADGWPGAGLLLQRFLAGGGLVYRATFSLHLAARHDVAVSGILGAAAGLFIIAGLWTPVAGVVAAAAEGWLAFAQPDGALVPVVLGILALTLAMIGPGAWSVDARLFGRKQIEPEL